MKRKPRKAPPVKRGKMGRGTSIVLAQAQSMAPSMRLTPRGVVAQNRAAAAHADAIIDAKRMVDDNDRELTRLREDNRQLRLRLAKLEMAILGGESGTHYGY